MFSPGSVRRLLGLCDQTIASGLATQRRGIAAGARMVEEGKEAQRYKEFSIHILTPIPLPQV